MLYLDNQDLYINGVIMLCLSNFREYWYPVRYMLHVPAKANRWMLLIPMGTEVLYGNVMTITIVGWV